MVWTKKQLLRVAGLKGKGRCDKRGGTKRTTWKGEEGGYTGGFLQALGLELWRP